MDDEVGEGNRGGEVNPATRLKKLHRYRYFT
jgi:hypothetical protein